MRGELDVVEFSYLRSCFFGCPLTQPLLAGTREQIGLSAAGADTAEVLNSADEVASFALRRSCFCEAGSNTNDRTEVAEDAKCSSSRSKRCEAKVDVLAHAEGETTLELQDADGRTIDRTTVYVREAARADFQVAYAGGLAGRAEALSLEKDGKAELTLRLFDARGQLLLAPEGVHWHTGDGDIAQLSSWLLGAGSELDAGLSIVVEAEAEGETDLGISVPGLDRTLPLAVH